MADWRVGLTRCLSQSTSSHFQEKTGQQASKAFMSGSLPALLDSSLSTPPPPPSPRPFLLLLQVSSPLQEDYTQDLWRNKVSQTLYHRPTLSS